MVLSELSYTAYALYLHANECQDLYVLYRQLRVCVCVLCVLCVLVVAHKIQFVHKSGNKKFTHKSNKCKQNETKHTGTGRSTGCYWLIHLKKINK